jgi:hypothetical protein
MIQVKTLKTSEGFINCYVELEAVNNLQGVRGAIKNDFISEIAAVFEEHYGVSVSAYPMSTRIEILNVVSSDAEVAKAVRILKLIAGLINENMEKPRTRSDEQVIESQNMQYLRSIGSYFKSSRSIGDQEKVDQSFRMLKEKGANPWEMEVNFFLIRDLKRGFFKESHERILGIDELQNFTKQYFPK